VNKIKKDFSVIFFKRIFSQKKMIKKDFFWVHNKDLYVICITYVLEPRPMIVRFWKNNGEDEEEKVRKGKNE
jgi:hypothetical protein